MCSGRKNLECMTKHVLNAHPQQQAVIDLELENMPAEQLPQIQLLVENMPGNVPINMDFDLEDDAPFTFVGGDGDQNEGGNCFA